VTPRWNPQDGKYEWWSDDTGWQVDDQGNRVALTDAEIAEAQAKGQIPSDASEEAKKAVADALANLGVRTWRNDPKNAREVALLDRWNRLHAKDYGTISDSEAENQASIYRFLGLDFEPALDLYARYRNGEQGIPIPTAQGVADWAAQTEAAAALRGEIGVRRAQAGLPTAGLPAPAPNNPLGQAIWDATANLEPVTRDRVRSAMLLGAGLEGGGVIGPWTAGDEGTAFGPFQIRGLTQAEAEDPVRAVQFMLHEHVGGEATYLRAVQEIPDALWNSDPLGAATLAVANAERVGGWHKGLTIDEAVNIYGGRDRIAAKAGETGGGGAAPGVTVHGLPTGLPAVVARRTLTADEENDYGFNYAPYGVSREAYIEAVDTHQDAFAIQREMDRRQFNTKYGTDWSASEVEDALKLNLTGEDIKAVVAAGQKPRQWWEKQMADTEARLKQYGLDWTDLEAWYRNKSLTIPDLQLAKQMNMSPDDLALAIQKLGSADAVWDAWQMGYTAPAAMRPEQVALFNLKNDVNVAAYKAWQQIPEAIKPSVPYDQIEAMYKVAKAEARARGQYLAPDQYLQSEFPGLFGGGTADELRRDLEKLSQPEYYVSGREPIPGTYGYTEITGGPHGATARVGGPMGQTGGYQGLFEWAGQPGGMYGYTPTGGMVAQRAMAQAFLGAPGPLGTQTQAQYQAQRASIAARYPQLAARAAAGEFETEEQKRRRRLREGLISAAGSSAAPATGGAVAVGKVK
jgi:hypothetical protein